MKCQICGKELNPTYELPVRIKDRFFHRRCFNFRKVKGRTIVERLVKIKVPLKKVVLASAFGIVLILYLFFRPLFLLLGLVLLGSTWILLSDLPGVELTTLSTTLAGLNFGPTAGLLVGSLSTVPSFAVKKSWFTIFSTFGFALIGFISGYNLVSFILLGILGTFLYHLIVDVAFLVAYGGSLWVNSLYVIVHLFSNFLIFLTYSLYV